MEVRVRRGPARLRRGDGRDREDGAARQAQQGHRAAPQPPRRSRPSGCRGEDGALFEVRQAARRGARRARRSTSASSATIERVDVDVLNHIAERLHPGHRLASAPTRGPLLQRQRRHGRGRGGRRAQRRQGHLPDRRRRHLRGPGRRSRPDLRVRPRLPGGAAGLRAHRGRHDPQGRRRASCPRGRGAQRPCHRRPVEHAVLLEILTDGPDAAPRSPPDMARLHILVRLVY